MKMSKSGYETIRLTDAQEMLGVSRTTLWRLIRTYNIQVFDDVLDARVKLIRKADIESVLAAAARVRRGLAA